MPKPRRYVRLKDIAKLAEQHPDAILAYPVDAQKYGYSNRLAGEVNVEWVEMAEEDVGPGKPRNRLLAVLG